VAHRCEIPYKTLCEHCMITELPFCGCLYGKNQPTPVFGTVGKESMCSNCSHVVLRSLEASGPAVISASAGGSGYESFSSVTVSIQNLEVRTYRLREL
jgi:hypothetical protein